MARYFRFPFAAAGDRVVFPDETQADGSLSYNQGYGPDFQRTPGTDPQARRLDRSRFNQLINDITSNQQQHYQQAYPPFITSADNGGAAFPYDQYARVRFDPGTGHRIYESLINNNTNLPTVETAWRLADFQGLDSTYLIPTNNLSDIENQQDARTNLGLGSASTRTVGTGANQIPDINSFTRTLSRAGTQSIPGGLIVQWGESSSLGVGDVGVTVVFPTAFPNDCLNVMVTTYPTAESAAIDWWIQLISFGRTSFRAYYQSFGQAVNRRLIFRAYGN